MSIRLTCLTALMSIGLSAPAAAECVYPEAPASLPDGNTATEEQMVEGMQQVKQYDAEIAAYLNCLELETNARLEAFGSDPSPEQEQQIEKVRAMQVERHNAAVGQLESVAQRFNDQVRAFKARSKK